LKNYYKILGVSQTSSPEVIKQAYRNKAKTCHPDIYSGADSKEKFQLINEAYQILKNDNKRRLYDYRLNIGLQRDRAYNYRRKYPYSNNFYNRRPYYTTRAYAQETQKEYFKYEKIFDNVLFILMILLGLYAVGFGFFRLFYDQVDGVNPIAGIIAGAIFTCVIIYGWIVRIRKG